jgi:TadE-like protein
LCLPVVVLIIAAIVELALVAGDQLRLWHAARESARLAIVDSDPAATRAAAESHGFESVVTSIEPDRASRRQGEPLTVSLTYERPTGIPGVGPLFGGIELQASATMRIEQP